jgi:hypothetical protein
MCLIRRPHLSRHAIADGALRRLRGRLALA